MPVIKKRPATSCLLAIGFFVFSFWPAAAEKPVPKLSLFPPCFEEKIPVINLKLLRLFPSSAPDKDNIFFSQLWSLATDKSQHIALLDVRQKNVYVFSNDGRLKSTFGKRGQGPGEFSYPRKIGFYHGSLFVLDPGGYRLQFFDLDGKLLKSIKLANFYSDIFISEEGKFFCTRGVKTDQSHLVDVLDEDGKVQYSFGEPIKMGQIPPGLLNDFIIIGLSNRSVMLASRTTGDIRIYDYKGQLVKEIDDIKELLRDVRAANIKSFSNLKPGQSPVFPLFEAAKASGQSVYFVRSTALFYELIELNQDYKISNRFVYRNKAGLCPDFEILASATDNNFEIFLIELTPEANRVLVLRPEK
jgi:hypothetical protein